MDEISKKELLAETGISYGQLYRWKREGLIPEEWFVKRPSFTGQETFFPKEKIIERVRLILDMKDDQSLEDIRRQIIGDEDDELGALIREAILMAAREEKPAGAVVFETNGAKHFVILGKEGWASADDGVKILAALGEKEMRKRAKELVNDKELGNSKEPDNSKELVNGKEPGNSKELGNSKKPGNNKELGNSKEPDNSYEQGGK